MAKWRVASFLRKGFEVVARSCATGKAKRQLNHEGTKYTKNNSWIEFFVFFVFFVPSW